jgi:CheY-specific phosphatase CheX
MSVGVIDICDLVTNIWLSLLGLKVRPNPELESQNGERHLLTSCVQLTGGWEGAVTLECSIRLARRVASIMFGTPVEAASMEEISDALGEMVSITGGNIKTVLSDNCLLSLPAVAEGMDYRLAVPGSRVVNRVGFECEGQPLLITLLQRTSDLRELHSHGHGFRQQAA